jgi:arylformamidase
MSQFVELSRVIADGMSGISPRFSVRVGTFQTREDSARDSGGACSFETSEVAFQVPVGSYIDAPHARDEEGRDIAEIGIEELVHPGLLLDMRQLSPGHAIVPADLPAADYAGRAVLFDFGWAAHWDTPQYDKHPFLTRAAIELLIARGVRMVAVDCRSPDDPAEATKPAHTLCLRADIFIVENLINLERLHGHPFRFFAVPLRVRDATSFPIRAFAEIEA